MSGDATSEGVDPEFPGAQACRNLHGDDDTLRTLSHEVQRLIQQLSPVRPPTPHSSSISLNTSLSLSDRRASRGPSRARRQAWHRKTRYQRGRCYERLRPWQVDGLFEADSFARTIGLPL